MIKILVVFGTRPEAIKMAPLVKELKMNKINFDTKVCVTGQHREMLDQVLRLFEIIPEFDLNIMKKGQNLYDVTSKILLGMKKVFEAFRPDLLFVHGDTTTSMVSALAAYYDRIPVAHVEAGLRTNNIYSPWPEEINRQLTGRIASYHFAPTELSRSNLIREFVKKENIYVTGNTVIDALQWALKKINSEKELNNELIKSIEEKGIPKSKIEAWKSENDIGIKLVLITGHRRENFGEGFLNICNALKTLSDKNKDVDFVYPVHLNPNVRNSIYKVFGERIIGKNDNPSDTNIFFIEPLDYLPFLYLMSKSHLLLTDSGGIQEEAPGIGKPVLVMRETTERPEALKAGTVKLVGTDSDKIIAEVMKLLYNKEYYESISEIRNPYGDGKACHRIIKTITNVLETNI